MNDRNEKAKYRRKGISVVKASSVKQGDRILIGGEEGSPIREATVTVVLSAGQYLTFLHDLHPAGTTCLRTDEIMRLRPGFSWVGSSKGGQ